MGAFLTYLWEQSLLLTVLALLFFPVLRWAKGIDVRLRYWLGMLILIKGVLPPFLVVPVLPSSWSGDQLWASVPSMVAAADPTVPKESQPSLAKQHTVSEGMDSAPVSTWHLPQVLFLIWVLGFAGYILVLMRQAWRVRRLLHEHRSDPDLKVECEFVDVFDSLGLRRRPRVCMVQGIDQPFVWGWHQGRIYLPHWFARIGSVEERKYVLGHELGHLVRRDALLNFAQILIQAVYWFHPGVWWLNSKVRQEREKCCDEFAIVATRGSAAEYATAVVDHLLSYGRPSQGMSVLAMSGSARSLEDRIQSLLSTGKIFRRRLTWRGWAQVAAVAVVLMPFHLTSSHEIGWSSLEPSYQILDLSQAGAPAEFASAIRVPELPMGNVVLEAIPYGISGVHAPSHERGDSGGMRIPINNRFSYLYLFHGVRGAAEWGSSIAECILHYSDSSRVALPVQYGVHVQNWKFWEYRPTEDRSSKMAWVGTSEEARRQQAGLRLYHTPLANPNPMRQVVAIEYVASQNNCQPFVLGMTIDENVAHGGRAEVK